MDAENHVSQVLAAKAAIEQARVTKQTEKALSMFADAESVEQVCRYLAGFASVSWTKPPTGEFDSDAANLASLMAVKRLEEIIRDRISEVINGQVADMLEEAQAKINAFPDLGEDPYLFFKVGMRVRLAESDEPIFGTVTARNPNSPTMVNVEWDDEATNSVVRPRDLVVL
ncbi:hypothetical protein SEA_ERUTAN_93 [Gordonia phage Erutan]|uniref:Uncharacterized protein n=1 Tax=Gordonia phage Erutan TaxID=3043913 RepID=A0AA96K533_9CAUD|nr:hypothetical protein SEA_ERUTAN_93 [Gordonia phage Erutan]